VFSLPNLFQRDEMAAGCSAEAEIRKLDAGAAGGAQPEEPRELSRAPQEIPGKRVA
jgi:hypothetical protein